jgi:hypothetical protein
MKTRPKAKTKVAARKTSAKKGTRPKALSGDVAPKKHRIYRIPFASVYPLYIQKAEKKGRTKEEVDEIIAWLTGYRGEQLQRVIDSKVDLEVFYTQAPLMNPNVRLIKGVVCGVRIEDITDPLMKKARYLDKLIDELAQGKTMATILRQ